MASDDNVLNFPQEEPPPLFVGPFTEHRVILQGRFVPNLTGFEREDGTVELAVDHRFAGQFPSRETASQAAYLIAQAMAIASGYAHFEADIKAQPFAPIAVQLGGLNGK